LNHIKLFIEKYIVFMLILINYLKRSSLISNNFWNIQKPELDPLHIVIPEVKYKIGLFNNSEKKLFYFFSPWFLWNKNTNTYRRCIYSRWNRESNYFTRVILYSLFFIYKNDCVEYKECNRKEKFQIVWNVYGL